MLRLRAALREYFPAALEAFDHLSRRDALELLGKAPTPAAAAKLTKSQINAALEAARLGLGPLRCYERTRPPPRTLS